MKNRLSDLNDHLFAQMERLSDEELQGDALASEIERSKAVTNLAREMISNGNLVLRATQMAIDYPNATAKIPKLLES